MARTRHWTIATLFLLLAACRGEPAAPSSAPTVKVSVATAAAADPPALSAKSVDGYVRYQRALEPIYRDLMQALDKPNKEALVGFRAQARAEELARRDAGLSLEQISRLEGLVAEVVTARKLLHGLGSDAALERLEKLRDQLPQESQEALAPSMTLMREEHDALSSLAKAKQKYGEKDVALVLAREQELREGYGALMAHFRGKKR